MNAIKLHRLANKLYKKGWLRTATLIRDINNFWHNSYIPYTAEIGDGTVFAYDGIGVVLHSKAVIGKNCVIGQGITIGGRTGHGVAPVIGDNVYIAAGSRVLGGITVGNNVTIGANAVVIKDVPDGCVVAGVPAKVIKTGNQGLYGSQ